MKNKYVSCFVAVLTICGIMSSFFMPAVAAQDTVNIKTKKDFIKFASNCTLDTWSQGKTVNLTADIDFKGSKFTPVPIFGGTFNGNGHKISGISYDEKGSYKGIFRYIDRGGSVNSLTVEADFVPSGSKSFVGGIVGENSGTIENCRFTGTVKGENVVGGIVGQNTDYGRIISCSSNGSVTGENSTGGICGKNSGFIQACTNTSAVNTVYEEKKSDISQLEADPSAIIENITSSDTEGSDESVLGHTDTGGIAGLSSGIVQGCINNGAVGYKHIGYNVGGIVGRQSGYMLGCQNTGFVQGRKDVGGIVGQAEPYIILHASEGSLQNLKKELNTLTSMVDKFISDADDLGDKTRTHLDGISKYAKDAQNNAQTLIDRGTDFADDNIAEISAQAAILSDTLDRLVPVFENLEAGGENLSSAIDSLETTLDELNLYAPDLSKDIDAVCKALNYIARSETYINKAAARATRALRDLENAVRFNNITDVRKAADELSASINDIISAKQTIKSSVSEIESILSSKPEDFESIGVNTKKIIAQLKTIGENTQTIINSLKTVKDSANTIISNGEVDFSSFKSASENMRYAIDYLADAMSFITRGIERLSDALSDFSDNLEEYVNDTEAELSKAKENLSDALDALSYASEDITDALKDMSDIISDLADEKPIEFVQFGDDFKEASNGLFDSLSGISDEIDGLKNTLTNEKEKIKNDLTSVNNQFNVVMNLLIGEIEELQNGVDSLSDIFVDVSNEDIDGARQGKIESCTNTGSIEADRNTGGIVGNMAIEYSKDPEDDIEKPSTLNFTYRTKAILQNCTNDGKITGKKDCVGGIAGFAEIGMIYECENYGDLESTGGNYVGGIVGKSSSYVRKSYAKSKISGKRYIGGIAGKGGTVTSSFTIATVEGDENLGSICGYADKENIHNNFYVTDGLGALDGISYKERGEKISYDDLKNISGIPSRFISFTVTFVAEDKVIETRDIKYGTKTKRIKYPKAPEKDGYYGKWQKIQAETVIENITVECEYQPYITVLSSDEKNQSGKLALGLAEGEFTDSAKLHVTNSTTNPPIKKSDNVKVYDISLENTDISPTDTVTVRLLNENKNTVTVWQHTNGKWEKVKATKRGKYAVVKLDGPQNTICIKYDKASSAIVWIIVICVLLGSGASTLLIFRKKHKKV